MPLEILPEFRAHFVKVLGEQLEYNKWNICRYPQFLSAEKVDEELIKKNQTVDDYLAACARMMNGALVPVNLSVPNDYFAVDYYLMIKEKKEAEKQKQNDSSEANQQGDHQ
ncbi:unnamed protein product [Caenorhabditis auriculariae]|uniref:Uncharacterized protein n=1 Tax=Caenorhabditis auriculariae TaxID=2777116 RepID=A0A8S1HRH3_9PELO|nr:unnamed protein product [Caenorhabditis auriculariae]